MKYTFLLIFNYIGRVIILMNPETQGKLMVAMVISILAFGTGTGTVLVTGLTNNQTSLNFNTTKQSEFPVIPYINQYSQNTSSTQDTEQNDQDNGKTNEQSNSQTNNNNNNNNPSGNSSNTTN